jgi:hypothetical protein
MNKIKGVFVLFTLLFFCCANSSIAQNLSFYKYDTIMHHGYYVDTNYKKLLKNWEHLDIENIEPPKILQFAMVAFEQNDTNNFINSIEYITLNYGFDFREYNYEPFYRLQRLVGEKEIKNLDSLFLLWEHNNKSHQKINCMLDEFRYTESEVYQHKSKYDSLTYYKILDSMFNFFISICELQESYPNQYENGYKSCGDIHLTHILSVFPEKVIERSKQLKPFVYKSFFAGKISNSIYFSIDMRIYYAHKKQMFGSLGENIELLDKDIDIHTLKSKYLFDKNIVAIEYAKKFVEFHK